MQTIRLALTGCCGSGKTAIAIQFVQKTFCQSYDPTIEDTYQKVIKIEDQSVMLELVDTAGHKEYRVLQDSYLKTCDAFILVFSITDKKSFYFMGEFVEAIKKEKEGQKFCTVLVGNKSDLEKERKVKHSDALYYCENFLNNAPYIETSAVTRKGIDEVFELACAEVAKICAERVCCKPLERKKSSKKSLKKKSSKKNCSIL